jgi:hypothetical protein
MSLQIEREAKRARELLNRPDVQEAMALRCAEQGHEWEPGLTVMFRFVRVCKWCGEYV